MPRDRTLAIRMVLAAVLTPLITLGLLAALIVLTPGRWMFGLVFGLFFGIGVRVVKLAKRTQPPGRVLSQRDDPELLGMLSRLCVLADLTMPELVLSEQPQLNSWVLHFPRKPPRLYITRGLRSALTPEELQAVLGHELAHIANRDALVMSIVDWPGAVMRRVNGGAGIDAIFLVAIGMLSHLGVTILSRYRELAADAGSCAITGRPSALASALLKVSDSHEQTQIPRKDLRVAAALNAFNLVEVPPPNWLRDIPPLARLVSTHPRLRRRLDALEALESAQQRPAI
jgi:heat shock protein HtpX